MKVFNRRKDIISFIAEARKEKLSIGLVPTMGALHKGHLALVERALNENSWVVVSIFVNPTQFNNPNDLQKYPRVLEEDLNKLSFLADHRLVIFSPSPEEVYGSEIASEYFDFGVIDNQMEGKFRPGHFQGVATVVKKLFQIVNPDRAYFGEKDYQQLLIIKKMVELEKLPVEVIPCKIYREPNGLAMSSRNRLLSPETFASAGFIYKNLLMAQALFPETSMSDIKKIVGREFARQDKFQLEYFEIADNQNLLLADNFKKNKKYRAFIAVFADNVRLIDNLALN